MASLNPFDCDSTPIEENAPTEPQFAEKLKETENVSESAAAIAVNLDMCAKKLLEEHLYLTALELHAELIESGRELRRLSDFFSNPSHFEPPASRVSSSGGLPRSSSVQTFDSLDDVREWSDDGHMGGEETGQIAVLEFELRKAKETIKTLRDQLTQLSSATPSAAPDASEATPRASMNLDEDSPRTASFDLPPSSSMQLNPTERLPIMVFERRALNFLVYEYLMHNDYKMAAVTLSEEVADQDFEEGWDDVGVNVARPADLLNLYRSGPLGGVQSTSVETQTQRQVESNPFHEEENAEEQLLVIENQKAEIENLRQEVERLRVQPVFQVGSTDCSEEQVEEPPSPLSELHRQFAPSEWSSRRNGVALDRIRGLVYRVCCSQTAGGSKTEEQIGQSIDRLVMQAREEGDSDQGFIELLSQVLPALAPHVLSNHRSSIVPLLVGSALLSSNQKNSDALLSCLFNLFKKPDEEQRATLVFACALFARHAGSVRTESELLPYCWEQLDHKHMDRRVLVAQIVAAVAPFVNPMLCSSLLMSMVTQLLAASNSEDVRSYAVKSLAVLLAYIEDVEKFSQILDLVKTYIADPFENIAQVARSTLLNVFAQWALELNRLPELVHELLKEVKLHSEAFDSLSSITNESVTKSKQHELALCSYYLSFKSLSGCLFWYIVRDIPNAPPESLEASSAELSVFLKVRFPAQSTVDSLESPVAFATSLERLRTLTAAFDTLVAEEWYQTWSSFDLIAKQVLPGLVEALALLDCISLSKLLPTSVCVLLHICRVFGRPFTVSVVQALFDAHLRISEGATVSDINNHAVSRMALPVYCTSVLGCYTTTEDQKRLYAYLEQTSAQLAEHSGPRKSLLASYTCLAQLYSEQSLLLDLLWHVLVVSPSPHVRSLCAAIIHGLIRIDQVSEKVVAERLVPALITLAADREVSVRMSTIPGFGAVLRNATQLELEDKIRLQLGAFFEDEHHGILEQLVHMLADVAPHMDTRFREEFVLPRLSVLVAQNQTQPQRLQLATALYEAYSALSCCYINSQAVTESFLPGLRGLLRDLDPQHARIAASIITDIERRAGPPPASSLESPSSSSLATSSSSVRSKMLFKFKDIKEKVDAQQITDNFTPFKKKSELF